MISDKSKLHLGEDIFSLTAVCYLKIHVEKYLLAPNKRAQLLFTSLWVAFI